MPPGRSGFDPAAIRKAMLAIEARADREGDAQPVGEFLAEQLGIEWSEAFDEMMLAETRRVLELVATHYAEYGVPMTVQSAAGLGVVQGVTLALAVQELREAER